MNIALIGFRGTGKTTIAKLLAKKLDKKFISTDEEIEKKVKTSIPKFVKKYGWEKFRDLESEIIENVCALDECVFDTNWGLVIRNENVINLKKNALIVLLTADINTIMGRLKRSSSSLMEKSHVGEVKSLLQERESRYKKASDYAIDTSRLPPEEVCDLITHYVQMELQ